MASQLPQLPTPGPGFGSVVLHHIPDSIAPSFMAAMLVYAFCLGMVTLEIVGNISYDWFLARRAGWTNPIKLSNRLAYFLARFGSWTFLFLTLLYMTLPNLHCSSFAISLNCMWLCPLIMVDYIFLQRTLALYSWATTPTVLLFILYIAEVGLGIGNVVWFGVGYQLPESNFCAYLTETNKQPHSSIFIAYYAVVIFTDTIILCMTLHRLTAGGLSGVPRAVWDKVQSIRHGKDSLFDENISSLLITQGIHYYLLLELARIVFLIVYYSVAGTTSYQVLVLAVLAAIAPLLAGRLFRKTSEVAQRVARSQSSGERGGGGPSNPLVTTTTTTFSNRRSMGGANPRYVSNESPFSVNATAPTNAGIGILPTTQMDANQAVAMWRGNSGGVAEDDEDEKSRNHGNFPRYRTWKTSGSQPSTPAFDMVNYPPHSPSTTLNADTPRIEKVMQSPRTFGRSDSLDEREGVTSYLDAASATSSSGPNSLPPSPGVPQQASSQYPPSPPAAASAQDGRRRVEWAWPGRGANPAVDEESDINGPHTVF
ncbi:hypothetical protein FA10DRAFT_269339 [Acaromyces ingoldii]|uniref:Uncharacterized protein n=1 Tax=Acaromyces ingoldii TaxID=215250 RepID=A0A316YET4_9BASI|nr:hypothetical protein FA10DRAFT_269339 [Acaromyces ingoldii]PWN87384.1 hypothetical protein FA10DRAFT_269339 [Acaromyces ingoldii]